MGKKLNVFQREAEFLERVKKEVADGKLSQSETKTAFQALSDHFERLLKDARVLTSVSDRLHSKLNVANEQLQSQKDEIGEINEELTSNNQALHNTIEMLSEAKVSQRASTIVLLIAIILFVFSEWLIEPIIERNTSSEYIGLFLKGIIALLLKPIDMLVERLLMRQAIKDARSGSSSQIKTRT